MNEKKKEYLKDIIIILSLVTLLIGIIAAILLTIGPLISSYVE